MIYNFYMHIDKHDKIIFIEKFVTFCQAHDIWYAVDLYTLLGLYNPQTKSLLSGPFEVMMTFSSYKRLKRLAPNNVIDSSIDKKFKTLICGYVENNQTWKTPGPFIQIRLVLPTSIKKVKQFNNRLHYGWEKICKIESNVQNALIFLQQSRHEGYFWLDKRFKKINYNWSPVVDFATVQVPFAHFEVAVLKNSPSILKKWFGLNWQSKQKRHFKRPYLSPLQKINNEQKGQHAS